MNLRATQVEQWDNGEQNIYLQTPEGNKVRVTVTGLEEEPCLNLVGRIVEAAQAEESTVIQISTQIGSRDLLPYVTFVWGSKAWRMTPEEAKQHAHSIIEAAEASLSDAFLVDFFNNHLKMPIDKSAPILRELRNYREQNAKNENLRNDL